ncbi:MAG: DUF3450 domain-containing protein [Bacteroidota bacterium]|nr:DUF3450 domain-containing protein [Bacteroidota bacterium]MDX5505009.1 DUF3450 domain-containing protein [Bacteroidota bacterium]
MNNAENLARDLRIKLQDLAKRYQALQDERISLLDANEQLQHYIEQQKELIEQLQRRIHDLKTANAFVGGYSGTDEAKARISALVREIDKCIALLNE